MDWGGTSTTRQLVCKYILAVVKCVQYLKEERLYLGTRLGFPKISVYMSARAVSNITDCLLQFSFRRGKHSSIYMLAHSSMQCEVGCTTSISGAIYVCTYRSVHVMRCEARVPSVGHYS